MPPDLIAPRLLFDDPREQGAFTRWVDGDRSVGISQLRISGITCAACAPLIEQALLGCAPSSWRCCARAGWQGVVQKLTTVAPPVARRQGRARRWRAWRPAAIGTLWVGWPCGLLQSALLVAALSGGAADGALSMALFAAGSSPGLFAAPQLFGRLLAFAPGAAVRLAGAALALSSGWAAWHALQRGLAAFCV